jgi:hypothetical protein
MTDLYKHTFRGLMIDQHFPDAQFITFSKFDPVEQINLSQKAGVDSNMIKTKSSCSTAVDP